MKICEGLTLDPKTFNEQTRGLRHVRPMQEAGEDPFRKKIHDTIHKHWPDSTIIVKPSGPTTTFIGFALWKKEDWPNRIFENDPASTKIMIHDSHTKDGQVSPKMDMALLTGGRPWGTNSALLTKIGWRNVKGDEKKILKSLDRYFGQKLKAAVKKFSSELDDKKQAARR
jgi:hypothetical protein